jgi:hypothetical protein
MNDSKPIPPFKENNICKMQQWICNIYFPYLAAKEENVLPDKIAILK